MKPPDLSPPRDRPPAPARFSVKELPTTSVIRDAWPRPEPDTPETRIKEALSKIREAIDELARGGAVRPSQSFRDHLASFEKLAATASRHGVSTATFVAVVKEYLDLHADLGVADVQLHAVALSTLVVMNEIEQLAAGAACGEEP